LCGGGILRGRTQSPRRTGLSLQDQPSSWGPKSFGTPKAPPRVKLFFWLALHCRLWTADRRKRHGLQDDDACALCDQAPKTVSHLLLGCVFSRQIWHALLEPIRLLALLPDGEQELGEWWMQQRGRIDRASRP
jgi:hypothetical protein